MAFVRAFADWDWANADQEFEYALELDAKYWLAPYWYAMTLVARGRHDEADLWIAKAFELEPLSSVIAHGAAYNFLMSRRYTDAIQVCLKAIDIVPDYPLLRMHLGQAYEQQFRYEEATVQFEKAVQLLEGEALAAGPLAHVYARAGYAQKARQILENLVEQAQTRHVDKYSVGLVYIALDMREVALDWFERAAKERCPWFSFVAIGDPRLDRLRSDPRFEALLRLMRMA